VRCFTWALPSLVLPLVATGAGAKQFVDTFSTDPTDPGRAPFMWGMPSMSPGAPTGWELHDGVLEYRCAGSRLREATVQLADAGVALSDGSTWSAEVGFRHLEGTAPDPAYEALVYIGWAADAPGQYSLLSPVYDAGRQELILLNGGSKEEPIAVDLGGEFHAVRIAVQDRQARLFVDGELRGGPYPLQSLVCESPPWVILGPLTSGAGPTFRCQWDYVAFTDEGAFTPGEEPAWEPALSKEPISALAPELADADPRLAFDHPPYEGIRVLGRLAGSARFGQALPDTVRRWNELCAPKPAKVVVDYGDYADGPGPFEQNDYRFTFPLQCDEKRTVAMTMLTRGIDDTIYGFSDYKLWYCVSTDGGVTYDEERPLVQRGEGFSPAHPNAYVHIGKNGYVFATLQPFFVRLSNGQVFLPCYYGPLDESGQYYNPNHTSTYSLVFGLIGTWNDEGTDVVWDATAPISVPPELSSGGLSECAVIELTGKPGHVFMAIRGGNEGDRTGQVPCWKWKTLSTDYGRTWSEPMPLTFSDGAPFWSPTAESNFIRSTRTGKAYWIGNISRVRPKGGWPRYPLVIAELDEEALGLRRETVTVIDDRGPEDSSDMQLSNFSFLEDAATGHIVVMLNRMRGGPGAEGQVTYEIEVR